MTAIEQFKEIGDGLQVLAPAKINLSLLIAGKRPDGFHEIETVMAKVNFFDEILIEPRDRGGIELICKGPEWAPTGQDNLVYKACKLLLESCGQIADIKITLTKNIPAGSGLGSASSDAAATLLGVNEYLQLGLDRRNLAKLAVKLGSDVVFFLGGPLAFCTGRGEKIKKLRKKFDFSAILILPDISVSTKKVYTSYRHKESEYQRLSEEVNGCIRKNKIDLAAKMCANMLELTCFELYKELAELKAGIESLGIEPLCLSGSGSAMFHILDSSNEGRGREYQHRIRGQYNYKSIIVTNSEW